MRRIFPFFVAVAVATACLGMGMGLGPAVAQAGNETTEAVEQTATTTPTATDDQDDEQDEPANESVDGRPVDGKVTLTDWTFSEGTFTMDFHYAGERPRNVELTESTQMGEGEYTFAYREQRLLPGTNTITMTSTTNGGESAVTIATSQSKDAGRVIQISTGQQGADPFRHFGGTSGVFSGAGLAILLSGAAAAWVVWREDSGVKEA